MSESNIVTPILEQLEMKLDLKHVYDVEQLHMKAIHFQKVSRIPLSIEYPCDMQFTKIPFTEIFNDPVKMFYNELVSINNNIWNSVQIQDDFPLQIRPNYGIGIISSLFGVQFRIDEDNTPWILHLDDEKTFRNAISHGIPDLKNDLTNRIQETYEVFKELLKPYPKCSQAIHLTQPDMQGPFCNLQLIRGDDVFYDLYDDPQMIYEALDIITDTMILYQQSLPAINDRAGDDAHYILFGIFRGNFLLKLDTETAMISQDMYDTFCTPYNQRILNSVNGGSVHFCGGGKEWPAQTIPKHNIYTLNFGNPEMQDLLTTWEDARRKKISTAAYGWGQPYSFLQTQMERGLKDGVTFMTKAADQEEAKRILDTHREWCIKHL